MTSNSGHDNEDELRQKAQKISQLQTLIQEYPAEAQLIIAAMEDGLALGPAQVTDAAPAAAGDARDPRSALLRDEVRRLPGPDPEWVAVADEASSASD